jgi:hypothetical protein
MVVDRRGNRIQTVVEPGRLAAREQAGAAATGDEE